ncbi:hypothetical protein B5181_36185, partial [Streptomyces sp. 4F]
EAEAAAETDAADGEGAVPPAQAPVPVPQQQSYGDWDQGAYAPAEYDSYGAYGGEQHQGAPQHYDAGAYGQQPYQGDPYQANAYQGGQDGQGGGFETGQYDPYAAYGDASDPSRAGAYDPAYGQAYGQGGYDASYDPSQPRHPHGTGSERPDGSQQ